MVDCITIEFPESLTGWVFALVTQSATSPQRKPLLDEASFQQLLSAAYVLQEHNDRLRAKGSQSDFAQNLSAIVETQKLIQTLQLDLPAAAELVAERVQKITSASGTAIGIIDKGQLLYRAGTGSAAVDVGKHVAPDSALSADCLSKGSAMNYPDVTANSVARADLFHERDVKAFIAVPVYHAGQVAGVLELRFARANAFREADLRTAELMAGLLSEAMVTAARLKWKEALASERQSMLEALERIKPQLERLGNESLSFEHSVAASPAAISAEPPAAPVAPRSADTCSACGSDFYDESESFCGICGTARPAPPPFDFSSFAVPGAVQTKTDAPGLVPYGQESPANGNSHGYTPRAENPDARKNAGSPSLPDFIARNATQDTAAGFKKDETPKSGPLPTKPLAAKDATESNPAAGSDPTPAAKTGSASASASSDALTQFHPTVEAPAEDSLRIVPADSGTQSGKLQPYPWGSAKKAQQWLETVKTRQGPKAEWLAQQWQRRRANIYVVVAALMLLVVISGWGIRPAVTTAAGNASPAPSGQHQAVPPARLTLFEKLLVNLGLAEPPPAPVYLGNPDTQVWVDVHTALYHCPGSDLYGKTADGKFTTQRDAQQDQFEPANRKACP